MHTLAILFPPAPAILSEMRDERRCLGYSSLRWTDETVMLRVSGAVESSLSFGCRLAVLCLVVAVDCKFSINVVMIATSVRLY